MSLRSSNLQPPVTTRPVTCHMQSACSHNRTRVVGFKTRERFRSAMLQTISIVKRCYIANGINSLFWYSNAYTFFLRFGLNNALCLNVNESSHFGHLI